MPDPQVSDGVSMSDVLCNGPLESIKRLLDCPHLAFRPSTLEAAIHAAAQRDDAETVTYLYNIGVKLLMTTYFHAKRSGSQKVMEAMRLFTVIPNDEFIGFVPSPEDPASEVSQLDIILECHTYWKINLFADCIPDAKEACERHKRTDLQGVFADAASAVMPTDITVICV